MLPKVMHHAAMWANVNFCANKHKLEESRAILPGCRLALARNICSNEGELLRLMAAQLVGGERR